MKLLLTLLIIYTSLVISKARYDAPYLQDSLMIVGGDFFTPTSHLYHDNPIKLIENEFYISTTVILVLFKNDSSLFDNLYLDYIEDESVNNIQILSKYNLNKDYNLDDLWHSAISTNANSSHIQDFKVGDNNLTLMQSNYSNDIPLGNSKLFLFDRFDGKLIDSNRIRNNSIGVRVYESRKSDYFIETTINEFENINVNTNEDYLKSNIVITKYSNNELVWQKTINNSNTLSHPGPKDFKAKIRVSNDTIRLFYPTYLKINQKNITRMNIHNLDTNGKFISSKELDFDHDSYFNEIYEIDNHGNYYLIVKDLDTNKFETQYSELGIKNSNMLYKISPEGDILWEVILDDVYDENYNYQLITKANKYSSITIDSNQNVLITCNKRYADLSEKNNLLLNDTSDINVIRIYDINGANLKNIFCHDSPLQITDIKILEKNKYLIYGLNNFSGDEIEKDGSGRVLNGFSVIGLPDTYIDEVSTHQVCIGEELRLEYHTVPEDLFDEIIIEVSDDGGDFTNSATFQAEKISNNAIKFNVLEGLLGERKLRLISNEIDTYSVIYPTSISFTQIPQALVNEETEIACIDKQYSYSTDKDFNNIWSVSKGEIIGFNRNPSVKVKWNEEGTGTLRLKQTSQAGCENLIEYNVKVELEPDLAQIKSLELCNNSEDYEMDLIDYTNGEYIGEGISNNILSPISIEAGNYSGTFVASYGGDCETESYFDYTIFENPDKPIIQENGNGLKVESNERILWFSVDDLENSIFEGSEYYPIEPGKLLVKIINENDCESEFSEPYDFTLSIFDLPDFDVEIQNNRLKIESIKHFNLTIFDLSGKIIFNIEKQKNYEYNFSNGGLYFIQIDNKKYSILID
jgi:hypothetical protein